jgi:hypothetical protein
MAYAPVTPAEINRRNEAFWAVQRALAETRVADEVLRSHAISQIYDEVTRSVPIYFQRSFEHILDIAATLKQSVQRKQACRAATANRTDALGKLIEEALQQNPRITWKQLYRQLQAGCRESEVVLGVGDTVIEYMNGGRVRKALVSGLKDRLSRVRRRLNSR